jgi:hypothetical protein
LFSVRVISLDKNLVQVNNQKLCVVVLVVEPACFAFVRRVQVVEATNEAGLLPVFALNSELKDVPFPGCYDEKERWGWS